MSSFPPAQVIKSIVRHPVFWARTYDFSSAFHDALRISDEAHADFDALTAPFIREETDEDDDEIVFRLLSVPIQFSSNYVWELELYDDGLDAGVSHYLSGPTIERRLHLGANDAHPRLSILRWSELEQLTAAAARDDRNRDSDVADHALLLLLPTVSVTAEDPLPDIRARVSQAWTQTGLVSAGDAAVIANRLRVGAGWRQHPSRGWVAAGEGPRRSADSGFTDDEARAFAGFLASSFAA